MTEHSAGLRRFLSLLADFRQMTSLALKGVLVGPAIAAMARLAPPPEYSVTSATVLVQFASIIWLFQFSPVNNQSKLQRQMKRAAVVFVVCAIVCFFLTEQFTVSIGHSRKRVVIGWKVRPEVQAITTPAYTAFDALRGYEYDADRVWTTGSIMVMWVALVLTWMLTFAALTMYIGYFILLQSVIPQVNQEKS